MTKRKRTKGQTTIHKTLHRKQKMPNNWINQNQRNEKLTTKSLNTKTNTTFIAYRLKSRFWLETCAQRQRD